MANYENIFITSALAILGWIIKDFLFGLISKKNEIVHRECEYRLKEIFSPLYFWSGVVVFDSVNKQGTRHGTCELENVLSKAAYLIPSKHYFTLVRLIENAMAQNTSALSREDYMETRKYLYEQIELFNYLLFKGSDFINVDASGKLLSPYRYLLRLLLLGTYHLLIWMLIVLIMAVFYYFYFEKIYSGLISIATLLGIVLIVDYRRRKKIWEGVQKRANNLG